MLLVVLSQSKRLNKHVLCIAGLNNMDFFSPYILPALPMF